MAKDLNYTLSLKDLFSKRMQGAVNETNKLDSKMSRMSSMADNLGTKIAGAFAVGGVVSFGKAVFESLDNFQKFHASIKTMLQGNEYAAKGLESQLVKLASTTPFELKDVQQGTKQLMAYGFKAGEVVEQMRRLGDVSAGTGNQLGDIIYLYGTLRSSGRVTLMDLNQFAGRGVPIWESLAKRLNTTTAGIRKMVSEGKLGFKDIEGAFKDMTSSGGQFFNLMDEQAKTVGGRWSNISDTWEQIRVNIGKSQEGIIANTLGFIDKISSAINNKLSSGNFIEEAFKKAGVEQFSAASSFFGNLKGFRNIKALAGNYAQAQDEAMYVQSLVENTKDMKSASTNLQMLSAGLGAAIRDYKEGKLSEQELKNITAIRQEGIKLIEGQMKNILSKPTTAQEQKEALSSAAKSTSTNTGVNITAQRPQSLVINITKLIENLNLTSQNLNEGINKIKEELSKALLEVVNDVNLIAAK